RHRVHEATRVSMKVREYVPMGRLSIAVTIALLATSAAATSVTATSSSAGGEGRSAADWTLRPGPGQVALLAGAPGLDVALLDAAGEVAATGDVDLLGSLLFADLEPGEYTLR